MTIYGGPDIITDGLVLHLDAGNSKSYPGSGTSWFDLSGNNNHATLTNGPVYNSQNKGTIVFDGINDFASLNRPSQLVNGGQMSIVMIARWNTKAWNNNYSTGLQTLIDNNHSSSPLPGGAGFVIQDRPDLTNAPLTASFRPAVSGATSSYRVGNNSWVHITATYDASIVRLYLNGIINNESNQAGGLTNLQPLINIARWQRELSRYAAVSIGAILMYSRNLTANEVISNYNALKGRYSL